MEKSNTVKALKLGGLILAGVVASGALGASIQHYSSADDVATLVASAEQKAFEAGKASVVIPSVDVNGIKAEAFAAGVASVKPTEVPGPVQIKEVGSEELAEIEQAIMDNDGNVSFCTADLEDDEVALIGDCLVLTNDFKEVALAEAKSEIADLVDGKVVNATTLDEDDVERIRLNDDLDEIEVSDLDFEDKDANVYVTGTFEHDDVKYEFEVEVEFKDGKVDDVSLESVVLA